MSERLAAATAPAHVDVPTTMRAVVKERPGPGAALREVPVPRPGPGELLVRVRAASVCGTDLHIFRWDPWAEENFTITPLVFGHELGGEVVARGDSLPSTTAPRIEIGQLIGAESHIVDWTCYQCRTGRQHVCRNLRILGVHVPGSFAEYVVIPEVNAWPSDGLSAEVAALQEPMGNAVHAVFVEEIAGQTVAVLGSGPIGLMAIGIAHLAGAARVFATDVNAERLALAQRMGADVTIDAREDVVARLRDETDGNGVDVVLEMSGAAQAIHQGFAAVTNGGRISLLGIPPGPLPIDLSREVIFKGVRVYGITGRRMFETWYRTRALLDEGFDPSPIISHRLPLDRFADAFDLVASGRAAKVVLLPTADASPADASPEA
jgi:threonine 3-dehydrogenase